MYTIGICDDEAIQVNILTEYIQEICGAKGLEVNIVKCNSGEELVESLEHHTYDLVFLDIEMGGMDGLETGKQVREALKDAIIVFITGFKDYALDSFQIKAFDYIIKPISKQRFHTIFLEAIERIDDLTFLNKKKKKFTIKSREGMKSLSLSNIYYFEKKGKYVQIHTSEGIFDYRSTLKGCLQQLNDPNFIQCHQGFIVNLDGVTNRDQSAMMIGALNQKIPIGKTYRKNVLRAIEGKLMKGW